jgi:hypothetical protein
VQVPLQAGAEPRQSADAQQWLTGMQAPLHGLKPLAQAQTPAPVQVKFVPHETAAGATQAPPAQVPGPTLFVPEQVGDPQLPEG